VGGFILSPADDYIIELEMLLHVDTVTNSNKGTGLFYLSFTSKTNEKNVHALSCPAEVLNVIIKDNMFWLALGAFIYPLIVNLCKSDENVSVSLLC